MPVNESSAHLVAKLLFVLSSYLRKRFFSVIWGLLRSSVSLQVLSFFIHSISVTFGPNARWFSVARLMHKLHSGRSMLTLLQICVCQNIWKASIEGSVTSSLFQFQIQQKNQCQTFLDYWHQNVSGSSKIGRKDILYFLVYSNNCTSHVVFKFRSISICIALLWFRSFALNRSDVKLRRKIIHVRLQLTQRLGKRYKKRWRRQYGRDLLLNHSHSGLRPSIHYVRNLCWRNMTALPPRLDFKIFEAFLCVKTVSKNKVVDFL